MEHIEYLSPVTLQTFLTAAAGVLLVVLLVRWLIGPPAAIARRPGLYILRGLILLVLAALLLNPVRVQELPGSVDPPDVYCLLDSSHSMAMGTPATRWDESLRTIREADALGTRSHARLHLFRFGQKLAAIDPAQLGLDGGQRSTARAKSLPAVGPTDADTQLAGALRQVSSRFGRALPAGVVLFSDGRARDEADVEKTARYLAKLGVAIHVVPVGDTGRGGDVAIEGVVAPTRVRRRSQVHVQAYLRSYGYDGRRADVVLSSVGEPGGQPRKLESRPIVLQSGKQTVDLTFQSEVQMRKLEVSIAPQEDEISTDNNRLTTDIEIDRTKIRVLYIEGNPQAYQARRGDSLQIRGAYSDLQDVLSEDEDIECVVLIAVQGSRELRRITNTNAAYVGGFPATLAELAAFDSIVLSNAPRDMLTDKQLQWIEYCVADHGIGVCMVGGPASFAAGGWRDSLLEQMLPVEMLEATDDWSGADQIAVRPVTTGGIHPIWHIVSDEKLNREIVGSFPPFAGGNRLPRAKSGVATVLATTSVGQGDPLPVLAVGQYGRGRSLALAGAITPPWATEFLRWGQNDRRYYSKFWRNCIYWLAGNSIGRDRLFVTTDKASYRPGEEIQITAQVYDEGAMRTTDYSVQAMIDPVVSTISGDAPSPIRWPDGLPRTGEGEGKFIAWGEEFPVPRAGKDGYGLKLPIHDTLAAATASQAMRIEVVAYENGPQIDSKTVNIQILDDPYEAQNPFPNHELLRRAAEVSGGKVFSGPADLANYLEDLPLKVGPPAVRRAPLWNRWWLVSLLVGMLAVEWVWRRAVGLA